MKTFLMVLMTAPLFEVAIYNLFRILQRRNRNNKKLESIFYKLSITFKYILWFNLSWLMILGCLIQSGEVVI